MGLAARPAQRLLQRPRLWPYHASLALRHPFNGRSCQNGNCQRPPPAGRSNGEAKRGRDPARTAAEAHLRWPHGGFRRHGNAVRPSECLHSLTTDVGASGSEVQQESWGACPLRYRYGAAALADPAIEETPAHTLLVPAPILPPRPDRPPGVALRGRWTCTAPTTERRGEPCCSASLRRLSRAPLPRGRWSEGSTATCRHWTRSTPWCRTRSAAWAPAPSWCASSPRRPP